MNTIKVRDGITNELMMHFLSIALAGSDLCCWIVMMSCPVTVDLATVGFLFSFGQMQKKTIVRAGKMINCAEEQT